MVLGSPQQWAPHQWKASEPLGYLPPSSPTTGPQNNRRPIDPSIKIEFHRTFTRLILKERKMTVLEYRVPAGN